MNEAPPLGIIPERIIIEYRVIELYNVIARYKSMNREPLKEWADEIQHHDKRYFEITGNYLFDALNSILNRN